MRYWPLTWLGPEKTFAFQSDCANADFVIYFGARETIGEPSVYNSLRSNCPKARILGCSTGTAINGPALSDTAGTALAVEFNGSRVELARLALEGKSSFEAGQCIAGQLPRLDLAGVLLLSDGLHVNGSELVAGVQSVLGTDVPLGGGLAGDGAAFTKTLVGADAIPTDNSIAALGFYGAKLNIRLGMAHGWDFFGPSRRVTRAEGAVLYEMDGKPALDLYTRYLGDEAADLPASGLLYPLLLTNPADPQDEVVRTVLSVDHDRRTMTFAGDIPQGWHARLMRGDFDNLVRGAAAAAEQTGGLIDAQSEGFAVLISCVGRRLLMKQRTADEVEATAASLSDRVRQIGFYSYGEIVGNGVTGSCGLHNQTMTVMMIQETA